MEILVRTQDGMKYREFTFPVSVIESNWEGYIVCMGGQTFADHIGEYSEKKHALHVMNHLISRRNYFAFDSKVDREKLKSIILAIPTDEMVKETPEEYLLDEVIVRNSGESKDD